MEEPTDPDAPVLEWLHALLILPEAPVENRIEVAATLLAHYKMWASGRGTTGGVLTRQAIADVRKVLRDIAKDEGNSVKDRIKAAQLVVL